MRAGDPIRSCAIASSRNSRLASCRISDQGCCNFLRCLSTGGRSAKLKKRSVATVCFFRMRSSRYSVTITPESEPKIARNSGRLD